MACPFCDIAAHRTPADMVYEDGDLAAFRDIHPHAPVHLLIIPKEHIESVNALDDQNAGIVSKMVLTAKRMADLQGIKSGYRLLINTGAAGGQVVFHLHMHLMGGWTGRTGK
jgi:histidine triad (HIT) family protein